MQLLTPTLPMSLLFKRKPLTTSERIHHSLRTISEEAKGILQTVSKDTTQYTGQVRERLAGIADFAGETSHEIEKQMRRNATAVDSIVHSRPYECLGIALGAGLILGILATRR